MAVRHFRWLARFLLWTGITERQASCFLCRVASIMLAVPVAVCNARDWTASAWVMAVGAALDVARAGIDHAMGWQGIPLLADADRWAADVGVAARQRVLSRLWLFGLGGLVLAVGLGCVLVAPSEGQVPSWFLLMVRTGMPDLSSVMHIVRRSTQVLQGQGYPQRAEAVASLLTLIHLTMAGAIVLGVTLGARAVTFDLTLQARRKGFRNVSDITVIVVIYIFVGAVYAVGILALDGHDADEAFVSNKFLWTYSYYSALVVMMGVHMQGYVEAGCHERVAPAARRSVSN